MFKGSSKRGGRGGSGGGGSGPSRNRNSFPPPTNRHPSPIGRMSSGGGGGGSAAPRQRSNSTSVKAAASTTVSSRTVEETFNLVPRESSSAFGMIIRLSPDLVDEIKRVEAQGGAAKIKFDAFPNNSTENIINVGGKEFKFTWSGEKGELCDIYEEHQSGEDGNGLLIEAGCAWRKLNVLRTLDESTTSHMKMRSVEAEQRTKSRKAIVLDPGNPSVTKQLAHAEGSPWRMSNKQKKEPPPKKRKVDPPPVPVGGPKPSFRPGASTPTMKNRLSASPGPSPSNQYNTPPYGIGNMAKTHAANENVTPVQTKGRVNMIEKEPSAWKNNVLRDTSGREAINVNKEIDLQSLLVDILKEAPMSLKALEKAVGDKVPNPAKKIEPILKRIANFQAPRYFLKPEAELESYKKHSPDSGSSPEHQQLLPVTECSRDQLPVPGRNNTEKFSLCEQNGEGSLDCLPVHLVEQLSTQENVDIEHHSPGIFHEEKRSENREAQARSSSDSDSDSDNSDSGSDSKSAAGSDSGSSSDSEASSNSKDGSDEDVDIMSDGDREPLLTTQSLEQDAIDLPGHGSSAVEIEGHNSDAVDIDGHDSDAVDIDGHGSDTVDVEGNSSDEGHGSDADRKKNSDNNWKMETTTGTSPTANGEVGISGQEHFTSGHDNLRERQNFIGQLFDDTENTTKNNFKNDKRDISERLGKDQNQKALDFEHYSQKSAHEKNRKSQSCNQLSAVSKDSQHSELKYDAELRNASASQTIDPLRGLLKSSIEKSNRHGKSNKHSDALGNVRKSDKGDHFPLEMLSSRSGKAFRDNQRDDVHLKNKFPRNKKDGESAIRPSLPTETSDRKPDELDGSDKDPKNVSGLSIGSSPLDSQRTYLAKLPKGNGPVLQKQVSELELGELPEPLGEDTALKPIEEKTSFRQSNLKPRELVAVTSGNHVTILRKDDDYRKPCGNFTSSISGSFTSGVWSEKHDVLGLVDDSETLFFIRANGEEISQVTKRNLKVSAPVLGLMEDDSDLQPSCLCSFSILTSDGRIHHVEISREPSASAFSKHASNSVSKQFPNHVFCFDYHPDLSFLLIVGSVAGISSSGSSGSSCISLWRKCQNLGLELLSTTKFDGVYCENKDDQLAYPKTLISPQGSHVASLDSNGCVHIFQLDKARLTLSCCPSEDSSDSLKPDKSLQSWKESLRNVVDFTWWSDHALAILKRSGNISIFDISRCVIVQEDATIYSMPVVERVQKYEGHIFLLESSTQEAKSALANVDRDASEFHHTSEHSMLWRLISFTEKTIPEMYKILVEKCQYQEALDFSDSHGLDRDEVFKSRWLKSEKGVSDVSTILSKIKDKAFVLSECLDRIGPTEDSMKALLAHGLYLTNHYVFAKSEDQESQQLWEFRLARLRLLQFSERLDTYLGISMGRYSVQDYRKFRSNPINQAAISLAESGRIGALNLLFKRHPYSLVSFMLQILAAIPETVPVETYAHLLPGKSPPTSMAVREEDWVECEKMVKFINNLPENGKNDSLIQTEPIVRRCLGYNWPSSEELAAWYKSRARDIDSTTGLLDNCICLIDIACRKGISELEQFHEDLSYLHQIIYSDEIGGEICFSLSLAGWEHLSDYEKFKIMLEGVKADTVVRRLHEKAIPFMQKRFLGTNNQNVESFLVKWLKEMAAKSDMDLCSKVIDEGCIDLYTVCFFKDDVEAVDCALQCLYLCKVTDKWNVMATMLSKLPKINDKAGEDIQRRLKRAEGHIEAGRLLEFYQVPKPINYFLEVHLDEKGVKQILRLMLSKFVRRQPGRSDNDWACMWRDLRQLQEKAFYFLDLEFVLTEFCRGLLKAGKFSLARNYLKGTGSVALPSEKAESLVINAAKEYFFSAPSLASEEIWKARECLNIFSSSRTVKAEDDIIDAVTVRLPKLGVSLLPVQFKQVKDPMEIIKMAITGDPEAYLHGEELIEVAKLLGLNSSEDISSVKEAIAREAAIAGDMQLAFDLCLVLTKEGHGPIWDLGAAIARSPALEHMDISSRKQLLGFALGHCDDESISELLHAWKDFDLQGQCETLGMLSESNSPEFQKMDGVSCLTDFPQMLDGLSSDQQLDLDRAKDSISCVAKDMPVDDSVDLESLLKENGKLFSFAASHLPWLLKLGRNRKLDKSLVLDSIPGKQFVSIKATALITILSWLAKNGFAPKDELIAMITDSIIEHPVTKEEDVIGCSFLLNLVDASNAVEVIEKQLRIRGNYQEIRSIMSLGMIYSLLHDSGVECTAPIQRRELLQKNFERKQTESLADDMSKIDKLQSTFWKEWKHKLEEKMHDADRSRMLERIIPGVETERFLSHDIEYIKVAVFSLIESVKSEKKLILKDVLKLADTYGLKQSEVILRYLSSILCSEIWTNEDITAEILQVKEEILTFASDTIETISTIVYPAASGLNKQRLAYIYSLLSECYCHLAESKEASLLVQPNSSFAGLSNWYNVLKQECSRVSFIKDLDFKNISELGGLNFDSFNNEVHAHINEMNLEALAKMVETLSGLSMENSSKGLISCQDVYKQYIMNLLDTLESRRDLDFGSAESFQGFLGQLEKTYDHCRVYVRILEPLQAVEILKRHFTLVLPPNGSYMHIPDSSTWQECLILLINFWIRLADEMQEVKSSNPSLVENLTLSPECISSCFTLLIKLVMYDSLSPSQAWAAILVYLRSGLVGDCATEIFNFCRAMVFSGCGFGPISDVFSDMSSRYPTALQDLPHLYLSVLEPILQDLVSGAPETQNLYRLLSSLSNLEGNLEELKRVRLVVWKQLVIFSENLELPSQVRVYSLELMQFISGKNIKGSSSELQSNVMPWDGSAELLSSMQKTEAALNQALPDQADGSSRLTNTLVALKSSQVAVAAISPGLEISPEDLSTVETSVSCFSKLSAAVTTASQAEALLAILEGWEELFEAKNAELLPSNEATDQGNDWGDDDWNDGWETLQESEPVEKVKKECVVSAHPLHSCWLDIFRKYIALSMPENVLQLIDGSLQKPEEVIIEETEAESLTGILARTDPFLALKISLLLPYKQIRSQCLSVVEEQLKQEGIPELSSQSHHEVLLLVIYSGTLSTIISNACYGSVFSFLCYLIGKLSREFQEERITQADNRESNASSESRFISCFGQLMFPCFVSGLVKADQQILAGFLVTKFMHSNPSLSLINVAEASLRRYLDKQLESLEHLEDSFAESSDFETLKNTVSSLRGTSKEVIRSALASLSNCTNSR